MYVSVYVYIYCMQLYMASAQVYPSVSSHPVLCAHAKVCVSLHFGVQRTGFLLRSTLQEEGKHQRLQKETWSSLVLHQPGLLPVHECLKYMGAQGHSRTQSIISSLFWGTLAPRPLRKIIIFILGWGQQRLWFHVGIYIYIYIAKLIKMSLNTKFRDLKAISHFKNEDDVTKLRDWALHCPKQQLTKQFPWDGRSPSEGVGCCGKSYVKRGLREGGGGLILGCKVNKERKKKNSLLVLKSIMLGGCWSSSNSTLLWIALVFVFWG